MRASLKVNGKAHVVENVDPECPLLYVLRDDLGLNNPRFGCGLGQCGACTVLIDGQPMRCCLTPLSATGAGQITRWAALATPQRPHRVQKAGLDEQVSQCAYCINGWIMTAAALLAANAHPTDA